MNAHSGICNRLMWMQHEYRLTADDTVLQKTPFSFDVSVWEFFWPLMTGARLVMAKPGGHKDPAYLVRTIAAHGWTRDAFRSLDVAGVPGGRRCRPLSFAAGCHLQWRGVVP